MLGRYPVPPSLVYSLSHRCASSRLAAVVTRVPRYMFKRQTGYAASHSRRTRPVPLFHEDMVMRIASGL